MADDDTSTPPPESDRPCRPGLHPPPAPLGRRGRGGGAVPAPGSWAPGPGRAIRRAVLAAVAPV